MSQTPRPSNDPHDPHAAHGPHDRQDPHAAHGPHSPHAAHGPHDPQAAHDPHDPHDPQDPHGPHGAYGFRGSGPAGDFRAECRTAVAAAEAAGALLRSRFPDGFRARPKGVDGDVVTDLDLLAERLVVDRIRADHPHDRILAEETGEPAAGDGGGRTWLVDPLDGSNNVVIGLPVYVVGIALCVGAEPVVGVVHDPVTGCTWSARRGAGAHGPAGPLDPPARPLPAAGPLLAWTQGHSVARDDPAARALRHTLELGSRRLLQLWAPLVAWTMLARGDIDGFVGYRAEAIDLPAGALIAREAGVGLCRPDGSEFLPTHTGPDTGRTFVAARPEALPALLELVATVSARVARGAGDGPYDTTLTV